MSHELRTPLNAIIGFSHLLQTSEGETLDTEKINFANHINEAGNHLLTLIKEILDLSRIESDHVELEIEDVEMISLLKEQISFVSNQAKENNIQLILKSDPDTPVYVKADLVKLKQVVLNLLTNGIKYNRPNGTVKISVVEDTTGRINLYVQDTGKGIAPDDEWKVFEPFQRLEWEHSSVEGTGIGLTICQRLIHLMDGKIGFKSVLNEGTRFFVDLPQGESPVEQKAEASQNNNTNSYQKKFSEFKILYIEDENINVELVRNILSQFEHIHLFSAPDSTTGIEMAEALNPHLIMLDLHLPGIDGYQVLELLKEKKITENTPVIALTAQAMKGDKEKGLSAGFVDYVTKPLDVKNFIDLIFTFQK